MLAPSSSIGSRGTSSGSGSGGSAIPTDMLNRVVARLQRLVGDHIEVGFAPVHQALDSIERRIGAVGERIGALAQHAAIATSLYGTPSQDGLRRLRRFLATVCFEAPTTTAAVRPQAGPDVVASPVS